MWRELQVAVLTRVRASAQRLAAELLGADLMGVAAAEQQVRYIIMSLTPPGHRAVELPAASPSEHRHGVAVYVN